MLTNVGNICKYLVSESRRHDKHAREHRSGGLVTEWRWSLSVTNIFGVKIDNKKNAAEGMAPVDRRTAVPRPVLTQGLRLARSVNPALVSGGVSGPGCQPVILVHFEETVLQ